ncbi:uncharacterized protein RJT21DRAFT_116656 [Scheffersomyces amazonensis]|uniref:uncharacterized protein n=1 Tax=Scheffersomyces amazonensis TaxID=1078765 RepID=UPI00315CE790
MSYNDYIGHYLTQLLLSVPAEKLVEYPEDGGDFKSIISPIVVILRGESSLLIRQEEYSNLLFSEESYELLSQYPQNGLKSTLGAYLDHISHRFVSYFGTEELAICHLHIIAIALLQTFVQLNFTGPNITYSSKEVFFPHCDENQLQLDAVKLLNLQGQPAYDLINNPIFLIIAQLLLEKLVGLDEKYSFIESPIDTDYDAFTESITSLTKTNSNNPLKASIQWWMVRCLQIHLSVLSEPPSMPLTASSLLLNPNVLSTLSPKSNSNLQRYIQILYILEYARLYIHSSTENLAISYLIKARKLSELSFLLTGAKAKRTKFQTTHNSALIILAKSKIENIYESQEQSSNPESYNLGDDLLLEKPEFESLDNLELPDSSDRKRIRLDYGDDEADQEEKLVPVVTKSDDIPEELKSLDPNEQPSLNDLDSLQLLLILTIVKQTSPSNDPLVQQELFAIVSRLVYSSSNKTNWSIFSRSLWERSLLETNKSRTLERGILQMTSLVEEIGINIKSRIIPQAENNEQSSPAVRLRFIHQLPLMPQWTMDSKLAEKYMSLGVIKSALDIYERLHLYCEAALCYAAIDNEKEAEKILVNRISNHPDDCRAISILGDIRSDPSLWEEAWSKGRYSKAKSSLSRYYYAPPPQSGLSKDLTLAIKHMHDCLIANPLNYENWFFYGCCGLESGQFELASEAFTRCVSLDDMNSHAWSNLASALLRLDRLRPAFNALKKALRSANEQKKSWKIYENFIIVATKLNEWNDVLNATKEVIQLRKDSDGEGSIDIPVIEKLVEILVSTEYPTGEDAQLTHYQNSCIQLVCNLLPSVINSSSRCWRIVSRVELWRKRPWAALECHEKAYRALAQKPDLEFQESAWNDAVEACSDLVSAYESFGELPGKHGAGDVVCSDWKYKAKSSIRGLKSKGKAMWEDSDGWNKLQELMEDLTNN